MAPDRRIEWQIWENEEGASGRTAWTLRDLQAEQGVVPPVEGVIPVGAPGYMGPAGCW